MTGINRWKELPVVSGALVAINVVVYIAGLFPGSVLYARGNLNVVDVLINREYGRILWSVFLHADIQHLLNNMLILYFLGSMIEKEVGHLCYAFLFFLSGIGGNLMSLTVKVMGNELSHSIGASGAVFGLDGVLLAMVLFAGRHMPRVTPGRVVAMIVLSLYSGFSGYNIDNAAHVGGLITGFLSGCAVCILQRRRRGGQ
ncbi:MAG: rhomboid family intramembrane serine protease [Roseburia sp.]|nr:rhomboid family intramembrane serine protease [Roseburia sp.]MCM1099217.1 rhomboid family intramembrane serine protease [Ruminococcus flavefaciens]